MLQGGVRLLTDDDQIVWRSQQRFRLTEFSEVADIRFNNVLYQPAAEKIDHGMGVKGILAELFHERFALGDKIGMDLPVPVKFGMDLQILLFVGKVDFDIIKQRDQGLFKRKAVVLLIFD